MHQSRFGVCERNCLRQEASSPGGTTFEHCSWGDKGRQHMAVRQFSPMAVRRIPGPMPRVMASGGCTSTSAGPGQGGATYKGLLKPFEAKKTRRADAQRVWILFAAYRKRYLAFRLKAAPKGTAQRNVKSAARPAGPSRSIRRGRRHSRGRSNNRGSHGRNHRRSRHRGRLRSASRQQRRRGEDRNRRNLAEQRLAGHFFGVSVHFLGPNC